MTETIQLLGSTLGLGFVAGIRLYATVLALGVAIRFGWFHPSAGQQSLHALAHPMVMAAAGVAFLIELVSDKVPWLDSAWDSFHTVIRPVGAAMLAFASLGTLDPALKLTLVILCGGVALTSHSSKAATRLAVNHSPEPFSNVALSVVEDLFVPCGLWLSFQHPMVALTLVALFLAAFAWLSPKIFRAVRLQATALWSRLAGRSQPLPADPQTLSRLAALKPAVADALRVVACNAGDTCGMHCAATGNIKGLRNSIGRLAIMDDGLVFVTRRLFRRRVHRIPLAEIEAAQWKRGLLVNRFTVSTPFGERTFLVFHPVHDALNPRLC